MKGVVLAGGTGSRLYPLTKITNKHLLPVFDRPMIYYPIESLVEAGIEDIMIVTGGESAGDFLRLLGNGNQFGLKDLNYTYQEKAGGIAEALGLAEHFVGEDKVVVFLGDNIIEGSIRKAVENFQRQKSGAKILLKEVDTPESYGVPEIAGDKIVRIEEKPAQPPSPYAVIGIYMYDAEVFDIIRTLRPSARGELEITDAIQWLVDHGYQVYPYIHEGWWIDTGAPGDMLEANRLILETLEPRIEGYVDRDSRITGRVVIEKGAEIINSVIRGPATIGEDTRIVNSYIGPFTSIYHDVEIVGSELEHCIVLENSRIIDIDQRIEESLIGRNVEITRSPLKPRAYKLTLGDHSRVGLIGNG